MFYKRCQTQAKGATTLDNGETKNKSASLNEKKLNFEQKIFFFHPAERRERRERERNLPSSGNREREEKFSRNPTQYSSVFVMRLVREPSLFKKQ